MSEDRPAMRTVDMRHFLHTVKWKNGSPEATDEYPLSIPAVRQVDRIVFHRAVTFLVGDNGTGKSTIMEALAILLGLNAEGGSRHFRFQTEATHSELHDMVRPIRPPNTPRSSFFLRAESLYNAATYANQSDLHEYGFPDLHKQSHGESFTDLLETRFVAGGLYLLDEPEAALSPRRQLRFLRWLHQSVQHGSQFIIATHSPILMGYPDAEIWSLNEEGIARTAYKDTEHYLVTRGFLSRPEETLADLLSDD